MIKINKRHSSLIRLLLTLILFCTIALSSCTSNYYLVISDEETSIYSEVGENTELTIIPSEKPFIYSKTKKLTKTKYGHVNGYSKYLTSWRMLARLNKKQLKTLSFNEDAGYSYSKVSNSTYATGTNTKKTPTASGGTVAVKGYTRKDGTYVRPHTRSAPRRH